MRIFFSILSLLYIAAIFILAESHVVDTLSEFNAYSLLHIPLYGILACLLVLSMVPITRGFRGASIQPGSDPRRLPSEETKGLNLRLFLAGAIALVVAIFDEIHQLYVPGRDGSAIDAVLDMAGIAIALLLCFRLLKTRFSKYTK
ncbi:MAG: VanZ like family [Deltaproteobacteria bacterium]|nr:VanZ like family [Deltaproteobacteria bacterium]